MAYEHPLADDEKRELLRIARATLREYTYSGRIPPGKPHRASLCAPAAVQVRLHRGAAPAGSRSAPRTDRPLYRSIQDLAVAAYAAAGGELPVDELSIEIAVIGPVWSDASSAEPTGGAGLWLEHDGHSAMVVAPLASDPQDWLDSAAGHAALGELGWSHTSRAAQRVQIQVFSDRTHPRRPTP